MEINRGQCPPECWNHTGILHVGIICLTQEILSHILKFYFGRKSLWRSKWHHFWVKYNLPLVRYWCVKRGYCTARLESIKLESHRSINTTSNMEGLKEGAQTVGGKNPHFWYFSDSKEHLVFFLTTENWWYYHIHGVSIQFQYPHFVRKKCFNNAGGILKLIAMFD